MSPLSLPKLGTLRPDLFGFLGGGTEIRLFRDLLEGGDSNPAIVVSVQPLIVAAYTGELDCVVELGFPPGVSSLTELEPGARLLAATSSRIPPRVQRPCGGPRCAC